MTSLVDVIFLLLLFFMLSSTFSRHGELQFSAGARGGNATSEDKVFIRLGNDSLSVNGTPVQVEAITNEIQRLAPDGGRVIIALVGAASSQDLVDVLAALRHVQNINVTVVN